MANFNFGNKEFLNIQMQVLKNAQDIEALKNRPLLEIKFVDELPETGEAGVLYLVPVEDGEDPNNYEEYVWTENGWELIGSTAVDISNMVTTDTDQEISGAKTFTADIGIGSDEDYTPKMYYDSSKRICIANNGDRLKITTSAIYPNGSIIPLVANTYDIGGDSLYFKEAKVNKYTVATSGYDITKDGSNLKIEADGNPIVFRGNVEPTVDGTYALGKSNVRWSVVNSSKLANDYSNLTLKGNPGITLQMATDSAITPSNGSSYTIGTSSARFKTLYLSHYVDWGNNVLIGKDGSNRFYVSGSDGVTKLKIGASESLCATKFSPDVSNTYDLGRTGLRWASAYVNNIVDANDRVIATTSLAQNSQSLGNDDLWYTGNLGKTTGQATIDISDEGVGAPPAGVYFFIYGNAQAMFYLNAALIQNAAYFPIRVACPVLIKDGSGTVSGATGNLKIERSGTTLTLTVASTISGAARTEYASDTQGWGFYIYHTGL